MNRKERKEYAKDFVKDLRRFERTRETDASIQLGFVPPSVVADVLRDIGKGLNGKFKAIGIASAAHPFVDVAVFSTVVSNGDFTQEQINQAALVACIGPTQDIPQELTEARIRGILDGNDVLDLAEYEVTKEEFEAMMQAHTETMH